MVYFVNILVFGINVLIALNFSSWSCFFRLSLLWSLNLNIISSVGGFCSPKSRVFLMDPEVVFIPPILSPLCGILRSNREGEECGLLSIANLWRAPLSFSILSIVLKSFFPHSICSAFG